MLSRNRATDIDRPFQFRRVAPDTAGRMGPGQTNNSEICSAVGERPFEGGRSGNHAGTRPAKQRHRIDDTSRPLHCT